MKYFVYTITVVLLVIAKTAMSQSQPNNVNVIHANEQKIMQVLAEMELFQWTDKTDQVYKFGPSVQSFYKQLTLNGQVPDSLVCNDMAGVALVALKALAEKNEELANNQRLLEESVQRLNQATEEADETSRTVTLLQTKITDLENKLMNLEYKLQEMEAKNQH